MSSLAKNTNMNQEARFQNRSEISEMDALTVTFTLGGQTLKCPIKNITSFGALIHMDEFGWNKIQTNDKVDQISILYNTVEIGRYTAGKLCHKKIQNNQHLVGVMFSFTELNPTTSGPLPQERRTSGRVHIHEKFAPYAWAYHPVDYDEVIHFKVLDISTGGAKLVCSARNNLIFTSMVFESLEILLPTVGALKVKMKITNINPDPHKDGLILNVAFLEKDKDFEKKISKYLIGFGKKNTQSLISDIRASGLKPKNLKSHIDYDYVRNEADYQKVLSLRKEAYSRSKKVDQDTPIEKMADVFDLNSIIIVARHQGEIIGSIRITYCKDPLDRYELDESLELPKNLKRSETVEMSRLSVSNEFQGTDVVHGLIERCTEVTVKLGIKQIITSCVDSMLKYYANLGFYPKGEVFYLKTLNNVPHYFLIHQTHTSQRSIGLNPLYWFFSYSNIVKHLSKFHMVSDPKLSRIQKAYISIGLKLFEKQKSKAKKPGQKK